MPQFTKNQLMWARYIRKQKEKGRTRARQDGRAQRHKDEMTNRRIDKLPDVNARAKKQIEQMQNSPSRMGVRLLKEIASSATLSGEVRAQAAAVLLRWTDGNFYVRPRRTRSRTADGRREG